MQGHSPPPIMPMNAALLVLLAVLLLVVASTVKSLKSDGFRDFCLGTENSRTLISVDNLNHYARLRKSFVRCRRIIGNLEITHIGNEDFKVKQEGDFGEFGEKAAAGKGNQSEEKPFQFLEHLEEITGYLLLFNLNITELTLPQLRVIWGEKLHDGNALQVDSNPSLRILNMPALRTIEEGNLVITRSPNLCYLQPSKGDLHRFVDFSEILSRNMEMRLRADGFSKRCRAIAPCHDNCGEHCFGPSEKHCQTIYRKICKQSCESGACFLDAQHTSRCCDDACAGGCFGEGRDQCVACKKFVQDGKCVGQCRGTHGYNPQTLEREELPESDRRFAYGRHCVSTCPNGTLIEDEHCVARCSPGNYRNAQTDNKRCVPCPDGQCPRVCQLDEPLNADNIRTLANCSEIEGNIEILGYAFEEHLPPGIIQPFGPIAHSTPRLVPALNASQLEVLRSVRIVTGFVVVDGSKTRSRLKPNSLGFLENLEVIEGRRLYYEKYALYVIGNPDLKWLGLRALRQIDTGLVSVQHNERLCYSHSVPFDRLLGVREYNWKDNMEPAKCEARNRKCDANCAAAWGCWGPGPAQCVRCANFSKDGECVPDCPSQGYFVAQPTPQLCQRCHEQCRQCHGPLATQCTVCANFQLWVAADSAIGLERVLPGPVDGAVHKCVAECPEDTFLANGLCLPCHPACREGCSGGSEVLGQGGCNKCQFAVDNGRQGLKCLLGEEPVNAICGERNGLGAGYFLALEQATTASKFICRKCRAECRSCSRDGVAAETCECAFWDLAPFDGQSLEGRECALDCGKGSRVLVPRNESTQPIGRCQRCHPLCDPHLSCSGNGPADCERCGHGGVPGENGTIQCLDACPADFPFADEEGICQAVDRERLRQQKRLKIWLGVLAALLVLAAIIGFLVYRCMIYQKKYIKEVQMHMPEIPPLDPMKVTQRPNMRRLNLIQIDELDFAERKNTVLGQGAFGTVFAGKWRPPGVKVNIPVAIKAINRHESVTLNEKEMLHEAGLMNSVQHEHALPVAGICLGGGSIKIVTLLRPLGSLLRFLEQYKQQLGSKHLVLYCYQISSAMEYLTRKGIVHRDLAARNVLVKNAFHVEVTDFGLAAMLQRPGDSVFVEGRVAVKWMAPESLRHQIYNECTDVWSFGVTCWEIITLGGKPYDDLGLARDRLARELLEYLEKQGNRLKVPDWCSFELQQELLRCWLPNPNSRPKFHQIKEQFGQFCRAPHIYIQERQTTQQMKSISSTEQRAIIAKLLKDSDFLDPVNVDMAEYRTISAANGRVSSPDTMTTDCFLSANGSDNKTPPPKNCGEAMRHASTGTASTRYKSDPVSRKWSQPWASSSSVEEHSSRRTTDEENYLMPKPSEASIDEEAETAEEEEEAFGFYTPVVGNAESAESSYSNQREYVNDEGQMVEPVKGYVNTTEQQRQAETAI